MTIETIRTEKLEDFAHRFWNGVFSRLRSPKLHDYTCYQQGIDYMLELSGTGNQGCITGQGKGIKSGEHILLKISDVPQCYEVKSIEYYSSPSTMWIATVERVM